MKKRILSFIFALLTLGLGLSTKLHATVVVDSICFGDTVTIGMEHPNGATYLWSTGFIMTPYLTVNPQVTTIYVQHWDDTLYHQSAVHDTFKVVVKPKPVVFISQNYILCPNNCDTLVAHSNMYPTSYQWYGGGIANNPFIPVSTGNTLNVCAWSSYYNYSIIGTYANGCTDTAEFVTQIQSYPVQYSITGNTTYLPGQSGSTLGLSGSEPTCYYVLHQSGVPIDTINGTGAPITFGVYPAGLYMVRGHRSPTCYTQTGNFSVSTVSSLSVADSLCKGTSITIGYPYTNGVWYLWSTGETTPQITIFVQYTTTYVVTVLDVNLTVIQQDTFNIVVKPNPNVWITGPTLPICGGSNVTLIAHGAVSYHWFVGSNSDTLNIFGTTTSAQFIVVGIGSNGCSDTMSYPITVQSPPTVYSLVGDNSYCANQQGVMIGLSGSESNCWYKLYQNGMGVANVNGTGSPINFGFHPAGTYTVRGFNNNVYCDATMNGTLNVTVKPLPGFIGYIVGDTIVCEGETKSYLVSYSSYATSFIWSVPNGASIISGQGTNYATIYWGNSIGGTVSVIGVNSCGVGQARLFNVFVKPKPNVWIIGDNVLCYGDSLQITAHPSNMSFLWSTGATTPSISGLATSNAFYSVIGTDSNGCTGNANLSIIVQNLPMAYTITGDSTYCAQQSGSIIGLNGSEANAAYYLFNQGVNVGYLFGTGFPISFGPQPAGTYTVSASYNSVGCQNDMNGTLHVTMKPLPGNINFSIPTSSPCEGQSVTYGSAVSTNATSYIWSAPNGATITGGQGTSNCTINWGNSAGGQISVMGVNACGIGQAMTFTVVVNPKPTLSLNTTNATICNGGSAIIIAISNAPSYLWSTGDTTSSITVVPSVGSYTYTMQVIGSTGCINSGSINIAVNPLPNISLTANTDTICVGGSAILTSGGAITYVWNNNLGIGNIKTVSPAITTTYVVTGTTIGGCVNTDSITIVVNPSPVISIVASQNPICGGSSSALTANGAATYVWNNNLGTGSTTTVNPTVTTVYTVTGTTIGGCSNTASITIVVNPSPVISIVASQNPICGGSSSTLTANGAANYIWNTGSIGSQSIVSPSTTTTYSVVGTNTNGCSNTASITLVVKPPLQVTFTSAGMVSCPGGNNGAANASVTGGNYPYSYIWNPTPGNGQGSNAVNGLHAGIYVVSVTDVNGCVGANSVTITEPQPITIVPIVNANTVSVSVSGGTLLPGNSYQYNWVPTPQSGQGTATATFAPGTTSAILTVLDGHYCQASQVIYLNGTGINETDGKTISVYPNPAKDILYINGYEKFQYFEVYNIIGKQILRTKVSSEIDISILSPGSYVLSLINANGNSIRKKFIKE